MDQRSREISQTATSIVEKVGFWTRFAAYVIDSIIVQVAAGIMLAPLWLRGDVGQAIANATLLTEADMLAITEAIAGRMSVWTVIVYALRLAYSTIMVGWRGQTVGMMAIGIKGM